MAELDPKTRDRLRASSFARIDRAGERHLPIHAAAHVRNAIGRFDQTDFQSKTTRNAAASGGVQPRDHGARTVSAGTGATYQPCS